jgi:hypothetical protein
MPRSPAISAIQAFLKNGPWITLLLALTPESVFNWQAYMQRHDFGPLPDGPGPMTISIVATWLLTFLFQKKEEPDVDHSTSFLRVIEFLKINRDLAEIKPLIEFLRIFQKSRIERGILPLWFELSICSIIGADQETIIRVQRAMQINSSLSNHSLFWKNLIDGMSLRSIPEWIGQTTPFIREHVLFELLKMLPETDGLSEIIKVIMREIPRESFIVMPVDLLVYFVISGLLKENVMRSYLFSKDRRRFSKSNSPRFFLEDNSLDDPICLSFLERLFPTICRFVRSGSLVEFSNVTMIFRNPHVFFQKLIETRSLLADRNSGILVNEMRDYLNMFFWNHYVFFPRYGLAYFSEFIKSIMVLQESWRFLFVHLWGIERLSFAPNISQLVMAVLNIRGRFFQQDVYEMCSVFMKTRVESASDEDKIEFLIWLINNEDGLVQAHFPMSPELVAFILQYFSRHPEPTLGRKLFWTLFYNVCATRYREPELLFEVNMDSVCSRFGLSVTEAELQLRTSDGMKQCHRIFDWFWIARIDFRFQTFIKKYDFSNFSNCFPAPCLERFDLFRQIVIHLKLALNMHVQQSAIPSYVALNALLSKCSENADSLKILETKDRLFLKSLFKNYLPRLFPRDELWRLLRELSFLFPEDVKQEMLESNLLFKMFHNEVQAVHPESRKRKVDEDYYEEDDCEIMCSLCSKYFQTSQIGFDGFGHTICRKCSQSRGYPIVCMLRLRAAKISKM